MRRGRETGTIDGALDLARQEVFDLQDSMNDAAENMPEQLNTWHAAAASNLDIALSFMYDCDAPPKLREVEVTWSEWSGKIFRPQRRDNVVSFLCAYLAYVPENEETKTLRTNLQYAIDMLNGVVFPGMSSRRAA
jgi:hypothetical protein